MVREIDLIKAFNRVSHQMVIEYLNDMHVPSWLLLILVSYLKNRSIVLTFIGAKATPRPLPDSFLRELFLAFLGRAVARALISGFFRLFVPMSLLASREVSRVTIGFKAV